MSNNMNGVKYDADYIKAGLGQLHFNHIVYFKLCSLIWIDKKINK